MSELPQQFIELLDELVKIQHVLEFDRFLKDLHYSFVEIDRCENQLEDSNLSLDKKQALLSVKQEHEKNRDDLLKNVIFEAKREFDRALKHKDNLSKVFHLYAIKERLSTNYIIPDAFREIGDKEYAQALLDNIDTKCENSLRLLQKSDLESIHELNKLKVQNDSLKRKIAELRQKSTNEIEKLEDESKKVKTDLSRENARKPDSEVNSNLNELKKKLKKSENNFQLMKNPGKHLVPAIIKLIIAILIAIAGLYLGQRLVKPGDDIDPELFSIVGVLFAIGPIKAIYDCSRIFILKLTKRGKEILLTKIDQENAEIQRTTQEIERQESNLEEYKRQKRTELERKKDELRELVKNKQQEIQDKQHQWQEKINNAAIEGTEVDKAIISLLEQHPFLLPLKDWFLLEPLDLIDPLDVKIASKFLERDKFFYGTLSSGAKFISDGAILEVRNTIPPIFEVYRRYIFEEYELTDDKIKASVDLVEKNIGGQTKIICSKLSAENKSAFRLKNANEHYSDKDQLTLSAEDTMCRIDKEYYTYIVKKYGKGNIYVLGIKKPVLVEVNDEFRCAVMPLNI